MNKPLALSCALAAALLLAGCTDNDWNDLLGGAPAEEGMPEATAPTPDAPSRTAAADPVAAPVPPLNDTLCRDAAAQDATTNGFDPATQQRVLQRSYQQCMTVFGR